MVDLLGFEPRQTDPESVVLPLHHKSVFFSKWGAKLVKPFYSPINFENF